MALAGIVALAIAAAAPAPGALASASLRKCPNKTLTVQVPTGTGTTTNIPLTIKTISTSGVSCASAYKFLALLLKNTTPVTPQKYKCTNGHFKVPLGYVAEVCKRPGAKIQYATRGG